MKSQNKKILQKDNIPFQTIDTTTLITGKGQQYLFDKISKSLVNREY